MRYGKTITLVVVVLVVAVAAAVLGLLRSGAPTDGDPLALELNRFTAEFRSAPVPVGSSSTDLDAQLERRLSVISATWPDRMRGSRDAEDDLSSSPPAFKGHAPVDAVCEQYVVLLQGHGIGYKAVASPVTNVSSLAYIYGYNSAVRSYLLRQKERAVFEQLLQQCIPPVPAGIDPKLYSGGYGIGEDNLFFLPCYY